MRLACDGTGSNKERFMSSYSYRALGQAHHGRHRSLRKGMGSQGTPGIIGERRHSKRNANNTTVD